MELEIVLTEALAETRKEPGLAISTVAEIIKRVWHLDDVKVLIKELSK